MTETEPEVQTHFELEEWTDNLSKAQKNAIQAIYEHESITCRELCEEIGVTYGWASKMVRSLYALGLAERFKDGRSYRYHLTHDAKVQYVEDELIEPKQKDLDNSEEIFEIYHTQINKRNGDEGEVKTEDEEIEIKKGNASYSGPATGIDLSKAVQGIHERPVKGSPDLNGEEEATDEDVSDSIEEMEGASDEDEESLMDQSAENESLLTVTLSKDEVFQLIRLADDEISRKLFEEVVGE